MTTKIICSNREELYKAAASRIAELLNESVEKNSKASFIVPGGTTPAPVFEQLSNLPLPWSAISVTPSDERWIDVDLEQSNEYLIKNTLLINLAAEANFIALKNKAETALLGEKATEKNLKGLTRPNAVTILGMGPDGHVASLFPGCPQIDDALDLNSKKSCIAIDAMGCAVAGSYTERMSLTLASLIDSDLVLLLFTGQEKLDVLNQAMRERKRSKLPIAALLAQSKTPVEVYWAE